MCLANWSSVSHRYGVGLELYITDRNGEVMLTILPGLIYQNCLRWLRFVALTLPLTACLTFSASAEEMPEGMAGWWYHISLHKWGFASDPVTACRLSAKNHHNKELLDMRPSEQYPVGFECKYLSDIKAVNDAYGPQWSGKTFLQCKPDYSQIAWGLRQTRPTSSSSKLHSGNAWIWARQSGYCRVRGESAN